MLVTISGSRSAIYAEAVRNQLSYTGMACITYDIMEPANQMHDGAMLALQMYAPLVDLPFKHALEDDKNARFLTTCALWLAQNDLGVAKIAMARVKQMTARWEELKMFYVAIIYGDDLALHFGHDAGHPKYSVCLRDKSHDSREGINDSAVCNVFDLVIDVNETSPEEAASLLVTSMRSRMLSAFEKPHDKASAKDPQK